MKKLFAYVSLAAFALVSPACSSDGDTDPAPDPIPAPNPVLTVGTCEEQPAEGGSVTVSYSVENPVEGGGVSVESSESWAHDFEVGTNSFTFILDRNGAEPGSDPRSAILTVSYPGAEEVAVEITQRSLEETSALTFEVEMIRIEDFNQVYWAVRPSDKEAAYCVGHLTREEYDAYEDDEALVAAEVERFLTPQWGSNGTIAEHLLTGDQEDSFTVAKSGEYVIFAYGLTEDGELTSRVFPCVVTVDKRPEITVDPLELTIPVEGGTFEVSYTIENPVEGQTITVEPAVELTWAHDFEVLENRIRFAVDSYADGEPDSAPRNSFFQLVYAGCNSRPTVKLTQNAPEKQFTIGLEVVSKSYNSVIVKILPSDPDIKYVCDQTNDSTLSGWDSLEAFISGQIQSSLNYGWGVTTYAGEQEKQFPIYSSGTVVIYAVGVDTENSYEFLSEIFRLDVDLPERPSISVTPETVEAEAEGGEYSVECTVANPSDDGEITAAPVYGVDWVTVTRIEDGTIYFRVDENTSGARSGSVSVSYPDAYNTSFTVSQKASPNIVALSFEIEIVSVTFNSVTVNVTPNDLSATYLVDMISKEDFENIYGGSDERLVDKHKSSYGFPTQRTGILQNLTLSKDYTMAEACEFYVYAIGRTFTYPVEYTSVAFRSELAQFEPAPKVVFPDLPESFPAEGGTFEIAYTIEHPVEGGYLNMMYGYDQWFHVESFDDGKFRFSMDPNELGYTRFPYMTYIYYYDANGNSLTSVNLNSFVQAAAASDGN